MEVGDDDTRERPAVERLGEHALPQGARLLEPDARVDDRPSRTVVEEPEIDVVEAERERHAEPLDAREHVDGRARSGRLRPRMIGGHGPSRRYARGFTHVSDHAKHALDP